MKFPKNNIIDNWLNENGNPEIARLVEKNLALTEKINSILKERCIKKGEFAEMLRTISRGVGYSQEDIDELFGS